jgi:hypothetical protein
MSMQYRMGDRLYARSRLRAEWPDGHLANCFVPRDAPQYGRIVERFERRVTGTEATMRETAALARPCRGDTHPRR